MVRIIKKAPAGLRRSDLAEAANELHAALSGGVIAIANSITGGVERPAPDLGAGGSYPSAYASEVAWREDNRHVSNGEQHLMAAIAALALRRR